MLPSRVAVSFFLLVFFLSPSLELAQAKTDLLPSGGNRGVPTLAGDADSTGFVKLYEIMRKPTILSAGDYAEAQAFLSAARPDALGGNQCEQLLAVAEEKTNADINRLNELFSSFQKLTDQLYARRVCKVDPHAMAACRRSLDGLNQRLGSRGMVRTFYANGKDRAFCREQLGDSLDILANRTEARSFSSVWAVFEETVKHAYPLWNTRYHLLERAREIQAPRKVDRPRREIGAEEKQFMYLFGKMQSSIRYLSVSNSW